MAGYETTDLVMYAKMAPYSTRPGEKVFLRYKGSIHRESNQITIRVNQCPAQLYFFLCADRFGISDANHHVEIQIPLRTERKENKCCLIAVTDDEANEGSTLILRFGAQYDTLLLNLKMGWNTRNEPCHKGSVTSGHRNLISQDASPNGIKWTKWDMKIDDWAIPAPGQQCLHRQSRALRKTPYT